MPKKICGIRVLNVGKNATLKEIYRQARKEFTAADLAKFCRNGPMISGEQFLADMEAIHEKALRQKKKKKK